MPYTQANRLIAIDTPLGEDVLLLRGFHGREAISRLFHFEIGRFEQRAHGAGHGRPRRKHRQTGADQRQEPLPESKPDGDGDGRRAHGARQRISPVRLSPSERGALRNGGALLRARSSRHIS